MRDKYLEILIRNNVENLYHFTSLNNLESILENGICNRKYMDTNGIKYEYTDKNRYDNQMGCISLSLDCTNKAMLNIKKQRYNNDWIVIQFDAKEILTNYYSDMYFCKYNASSLSVIKILEENKNYLNTPNAFNNMFDENKKTNFQAEILLEGNLPCKFIKKIYVNSLQTKLIVQQLINESKYNDIPVIIKKEMF